MTNTVVILYRAWFWKFVSRRSSYTFFSKSVILYLLIIPLFCTLLTLWYIHAIGMCWPGKIAWHLQLPCQFHFQMTKVQIKYINLYQNNITNQNFGESALILKMLQHCLIIEVADQEESWNWIAWKQKILKNFWKKIWKKKIVENFFFEKCLCSLHSCKIWTG